MKPLPTASLPYSGGSCRNSIWRNSIHNPLSQAIPDRYINLLADWNENRRAVTLSSGYLSNFSAAILI
jgi:hypothetical protein